MKHLSILAIAIAAQTILIGCQRANPSASTRLAPISSSEQRLAARMPKDDRRAEVAALVQLAAHATAEDDRTLSALALADRATSGVVNTVRAIDTARQICLNNISNLETTAYKRTVVRVGEGGKLAVMFLDFEQGCLENTGRPLDLAIQGQAFFKVKIMDSIGGGVGYTRNGNFFINNTGDLVIGMGDGYSLIPQIKVPPDTTDISISQNGKVEIIHAGATNKTLLGQIKLTRFINQEGLSYSGGSLFTETAASGPPRDAIPGEDGAGQLMQGFLESSNVDLVKERMRLVFLNEWRSTLLRAAGAKESP
jgi:flagellar basal body rod protein FlgG